MSKKPMPSGVQQFFSSFVGASLLIVLGLMILAGIAYVGGLHIAEALNHMNGNLH